MIKIINEEEQLKPGDSFLTVPINNGEKQEEKVLTHLIRKKGLMLEEPHT